MNRNHLFAVAFAVALSGGHEASAQNIGPRVDSIFARVNRTDGPGCVIGAGKDGRILYTNGYGLAHLEFPTRLTGNTIVEIGSVSKQFTTAAVVLLAQDGKLGLDDDVRKYVPELPDFGKPITLRQLMSHTSGLRDQWALLGALGRGPGTEVHTVDEILEMLSRQKELNFNPGEDYLYSNSGYVVLNRVVERVSGKSLAEFTTERIFKPLGMTDTQWRDDHTRVVKNRAHAYAAGPNNTWRTDMPFTDVYGNGGLLTTVSDLLKWKFALMEDRVGKPGFTRELTRRTVLNNGREISYALGINNDVYRGTQALSHGGSTAGYRAQLAAYPEQKLAIAVLCNASNGNPGQLTEQVANLFLPEPASVKATAPKVVQLPQARLETLAGTYRDLRTEEVIEYGTRDGKLSARSGRLELVPVGNNRFLDQGGREFMLEGTRFTGLSPDGGPTVLEKVTPVQPTADELATYTGTYRSAELEFDVEIAIDNNRLVLRRRLLPDMHLLPTFHDGFRTAGASVVFSRNAQGQIDGFRLTAGRVRHLRFDRQ